MQLLSVHEVKTKNDTVASERLARITQLNQHETDASKSVNEMLALEKETRERVEKEVRDLEVWAIEQKAGLIKEVESLESRKRDAEKPIQITLAEAERILEENKVCEIELNSREEKLKENEDQIFDRLEAIGEKEEAIAEREELSQERENRAKAGELQSEQSARNLGQKWNEYHAAIHAFNEEIRQKNALIEAGKQANEEVRKAVNAEWAKLASERRAIQDLYVDLEQAKVHLGIKQKHHG